MKAPERSGGDKNSGIPSLRKNVTVFSLYMNEIKKYIKIMKTVKVGDFLYELSSNEIRKFVVKKKIITETLDSKDTVTSFILEDVSDKNVSVEFSLEELDKEYFLSVDEIIDNLISDYKKRYETKIPQGSVVVLELYETDGYSEKHRSYIKVPVKYIMGKSSYSTVLTEEGVEWLRKNIYPGFDNGGYYRLKDISEERMRKLITEANNILEVFRKE